MMTSKEMEDAIKLLLNDNARLILENRKLSREIAELRNDVDKLIENNNGGKYGKSA